ncbi:hypothetical protein QW180_18800 [Vibrio sinaloensis]|nr:hypothetical protein [Vibrio sinaloensis]
MTSELSTAYPGEGGIYDWVKEAFNFKWAVRTTWFLLDQCWSLDACGLHHVCRNVCRVIHARPVFMGGQIAICVLLTWLTVWICNVSADIGVWVTNIGAVLKIFGYWHTGCWWFRLCDETWCRE